MRVLVTGYTGQLGFDVIRELHDRGIECIGTDAEEFDITDSAATDIYLEKWKPDAVIHCAAYTDVDRAEDDPELCETVNTGGTRNVACACRRLGAKMVYISTDYVFSGEGGYFYEADAIPQPLCVYGRTKLGGEAAVQELLDQYFIVRTSWVFGANGKNFIKTMLKLSETRDAVNIVVDQIGSPTYTVDLASLLCDLIATERYGIYHATNEGICSWVEFAEEVFRLSGLNTKVNSITTREFGAKAVRPLNSRLSKRSLDVGGFKRLPEWKDALVRYLIETGKM